MQSPNPGAQFWKRRGFPSESEDHFPFILSLSTQIVSFASVNFDRGAREPINSDSFSEEIFGKYPSKSSQMYFETFRGAFKGLQNDAFGLREFL